MRSRTREAVRHKTTRGDIPTCEGNLHSQAGRAVLQMTRNSYQKATNYVYREHIKRILVCLLLMAAPEWSLNLTCKIFFESHLSALLPVTTRGVCQWITTSSPLGHLSLVTGKNPGNAGNKMTLSPEDPSNGT